MNTEKCSQHFPWPQNTNVYLNVPELNNIRIYRGEKTQTQNPHLDWKQEVTHIWTAKCEKQMNVIQLFWNKRGISTPGLKCLWELFKEIIRPTNMVLCISSVCMRSCCSSFSHLGSPGPNKWFKSSVTVKFSPCCPPLKRHTLLYRALKMGEGEPAGVERQEGTCRMIFCSRLSAVTMADVGGQGYEIPN